ncbi:MAG: aldo/keto reductase [Peptoniphilaceae bacterium]|nr:aldo/keto reductase [Peptoniphilaceae bacterium]MDY6018106.1 aldo/keto reductase [Anaerococcus sp.]
MKYFDFYGKKASSLIAGCMRYDSFAYDKLESHVKTAMDKGINFFDHADIYGGGQSQVVFGEFLGKNKDLRSKMIIQSKCGISSGRFDFSKEHIIKSVEKTLTDLKTDYLDILLLHRPDLLMDVEEVNETFNLLKKEGKVLHFGVSNFPSKRIELLQRGLDEKIAFNQMQFSPVHALGLDHIALANTKFENSSDRDGEVFDYCILNDIKIQAWSPFQYGFIEGTYIGNDEYKDLNIKLNELAEKYQVGVNAIVLAWIMRLPYDIKPIVGTTNTKRLIDCIKGADITLGREEWYDIYKAAGHSII